jgi:putative ABC transport system permease protein
MKATQMYPLRAASWVGSFLGAIALTLSVSGFYGVLAYMLNQRTSEIGIRMALGATSGAVIGLVMRQAVRLAGIGAAVGLTVVFVVLNVLNSAIRLQNVSLLDAISFVGGLALVIAATAFATYHPARRATRVEPSLALRADV